MLSEPKFFEKASKFALYPTVNDAYFTFEEFKEKTKAAQTDKEGNLVILYANDKEKQHSFIEEAEGKGYEVLLLDSPIVSHLIQKLEGEEEKVKFARVDADSMDKLIQKEDTQISKLSEEDQEKLKGFIEQVVPKEKYTVQLEALDSKSNPFIITQPEFLRRMKEMQQTGGGGFMGMGNFPEMYNLVVNTNSDLMQKILKAKTKREEYINQALDLARLSQNLLQGKEMTNFIKRSYELMNN